MDAQQPQPQPQQRSAPAHDRQPEQRPLHSRRRRMLTRLTRFQSSPSLHTTTTTTMEEASRAPTPEFEDAKETQLSVSCLSLSSGSSSESDGAGCPRESLRKRADSEPFLLSYASGDRLNCPRASLLAESSGELGSSQRMRTSQHWHRLPDEIKIQVLGWLSPMELVQCSSVSNEWHTMCYDGQLWRTLDASDYYNRIPFEKLQWLVRRVGPFVRHLNLRGCAQLQENNEQKTALVKKVAAACTNLQSATFEGCGFKSDTLHNLVELNTNLVHLNLCGLQTVTNSLVRQIGRSCRALENLDLSFCKNANAHGVRSLVEKCKALRALRLCELKLADNSLFQALFRHNSLEKLSLGYCKDVTDEHVRILVEGIAPEIDPLTSRADVPDRTLSYLDLTKCTRLTDEALRSLAGRVPHLQGLGLMGLATLTDNGIVPLLESTPCLSHLDVEGCVELTSASLLALARSPAARTLVHLQASGCELVGDDGLVKLLRACSNLRNLEVDSTRASDQTLAEAAHVVRARRVRGTAGPGAIALRLVVFDCANVTWGGVREVLTRNAEEGGLGAGIVQLKCFYEFQRTVDQHSKMVLRGDLERARLIEERWAEYMLAREAESGRRRRRRRRERDEGDEVGLWGGRRRSRVGCAIM